MITGITIREALRDDAAGFIALFEVLDSETQFMLFEPGERQSDLEKQASRLDAAHASESEHFVCAVDEKSNQIVGFAAAFRPSNMRDKHKASLVVGIMLDYVGKGIGTALLDTLQNWCLQKQIHRMQLSVSTTNLVAIRLYLKLGFRIEGLQTHAIQLPSGYVDQYLMAKILD